MSLRNRKVVIVGGGGMVGAAAAHTIAIKEVAKEIILIDVAEQLAAGQAADINHATASTNGVYVRVGSYSDIDENDIVIITCGAAQKPGQTRLDLLDINVEIMKDVIKKIIQNNKKVFIVVVANPVDVLTFVALKESGLPKGRVFGTGTSLDTARLRVLLAQRLKVSQKEVTAYILGEHGDSSFSALGGADIGGIPIADFPGFKENLVKNINTEIRQAAYDIIEAKKSTYFGIGNVVSQIVEAMMSTTATILPVCSLAEGEYGLSDVVIGLPHAVSAHGAQILDGYPLTKEEQSQLLTSSGVIKKAIAQVR